MVLVPKSSSFIFQLLLIAVLWRFRVFDRLYSAYLRSIASHGVSRDLWTLHPNFAAEKEAQRKAKEEKKAAKKQEKVVKVSPPISEPEAPIHREFARGTFRSSLLGASGVAYNARRDRIHILELEIARLSGQVDAQQRTAYVPYVPQPQTVGAGDALGMFYGTLPHVAMPPALAPTNLNRGAGSKRRTTGPNLPDEPEELGPAALNRGATAKGKSAEPEGYELNDLVSGQRQGLSDDESGVTIGPLASSVL